MSNEVAKPTAAVEGLQQSWSLVKDLLGGTFAMRTAASKHMPRWPNEDDAAYKSRLQVATLFPAYSRTVKTLTGKPFSKPISFSKDPSSRVQALCEDVDLQGRNLHVFMSEVTETAIGYGMGGILVDSPKVERIPGKIYTQQEEQQMGVRPYMIQIFPMQILGWKCKRVQGVETLLQLRIMESVTEEGDGEFAENHVEQVRVLEPGSWRIFREKTTTNGTKEWVEHDKGATSIKVIPFVPVYGNRIAYMMGTPPMLELAHMNVKHWQSQSDQDTILHVARVPILAISGIDDPDGTFMLTVGASSAIKLPIGGELKFVEHTGAGIGAGKVSLDDLKEEMRQAGAELLVIKPGAVTATQIATEDSVGMCDLQRIVQGAEDSADQALGFMGQWLGEGDSESGNVAIHNDFGAMSLAEASADLLHRMAQSGHISRETLLKELQRRGIIAADVDLEAEQERIAADGPPLGSLTGPGTLPPPTQ